MSKSQLDNQRKISQSNNSQSNDQNPSLKSMQLTFQKTKTISQFQVQSEVIQHSRHKQLGQAYKRKLLKLMVLVKLEQTGLHNNLVCRSIMKTEIQHMESSFLMSSSLNKLSEDIFVSIMDILVDGMEGYDARKTHRQSLKRQNESQFKFQPSIQPKPKQQVDNQIHMPPPKKLVKQILCSICYQTTTNYCQQKCFHSFCHECIRSSIKQNISSGNYIINCPEYNCKQLISTKNIKMLFTEAEYKRYEYFYDKHLKELNPNNKFCTKPDCGQVLKQVNKRLRCQKCSSQYCQVCNQAYHEEKPCDFVLMQTLQHTYDVFNIKKCPSCQAPIEKESGCNHMHCKKCKHEFCWICLKKYTHHHYKYYNCLGCPGMQFQEQNQIVVQRIKQVVFYILLPIILIIAIALYISALPFIIVGNYLYRPLHWIKNHQDFIESSCIQMVCFRCFKTQVSLFSCLGIIFLWILYQPRALLYSIFVIPAKTTAALCSQLCRSFQ